MINIQIPQFYLEVNSAINQYESKTLAADLKFRKDGGVFIITEYITIF